MMENELRAFEIFKQLCEIPHKSFYTDEMFAFLCEFCKNCGYDVKTDCIKNIYAHKIAKPKICLQAHYDMVGVGNAESNKPLEVFIDSQFVRAKDSSLGADNGAAIGAILALMQERDDIEVLFTNDEEVGMIGASNLEIPIKSKNLLNLDSEFFGEIVVGCAGGFDVKAQFRPESKIQTFGIEYSTKSHTQESVCVILCQVKAFGFLGGHSGIDIHKNIPSSIVEFFTLLKDVESKIISINAGEKSNSIPVGLEAKMIFWQNLECLAKNCTQNGYKISLQKDKKQLIVYIGNDMGFIISELKQDNSECVVYDTKRLASLILGLGHGVFTQERHLVLGSLNIAMISQATCSLELKLKARANTKALLERIQSHIQSILKQNLGEEGIISDMYMPWERDISDTNPLLKVIIEAFGWRLIDVGEIHAGLECGILQERFRQMGLKDISVASIGPTILHPHSINECLDLGSFEEFNKVLRNIVQRL